jgi:hypothetical protein
MLCGQCIRPSAVVHSQPLNPALPSCAVLHRSHVEAADDKKRTKNSGICPLLVTVLCETFQLLMVFPWASVRSELTICRSVARHSGGPPPPLSGDLPDPAA